VQRMPAGVIRRNVAGLDAYRRSTGLWT